MFRLIVETQFLENYGTAERPRWKFKGGSAYVIARLTTEQVVALGSKGLEKLVHDARDHYTWCSDDSESYMIDWMLLAPGEYTYSEGLQMQYEGKITYPAREIGELVD